MFFNEGRAVQIVGTLKCLTDSMCLTTPRFITSSRRKMRKTPARRSKRPKTLTEVLNHVVNDLHDLLLLVVLAIHIVVDHQLTCTSCCQTCCKKKKKMMTTETNTTYHILIGKKFKLKRYIPTATSLVFSS